MYNKEIMAFLVRIWGVFSCDQDEIRICDAVSNCCGQNVNCFASYGLVTDHFYFSRGPYKYDASDSFHIL